MPDLNVLTEDLVKGVITIGMELQNVVKAINKLTKVVGGLDKEIKALRAGEWSIPPNPNALPLINGPTDDPREDS